MSLEATAQYIANNALLHMVAMSPKDFHTFGLALPTHQGQSIQLVRTYYKHPLHHGSDSLLQESIGNRNFRAGFQM